RTGRGLFWGIFMLMAMLGFASSMQEGTKRQMKGIATNVLWVWGQTTTIAYDGMPIGRQVKFDISDIENLRRLPDVEWLAPRLRLGGWLSGYNVTYAGKTGRYAGVARQPRLPHTLAVEDQGGRAANGRQR